MSNSNLQMFYTKTPVTTIIEENSKDLRLGHVRTTPIPSFITTAREILEKRIDSTHTETTLFKRDQNVHPYAEFLFTKMPPKAHKSPLDYGYPESFKFVQELNELPKNHKPEWALTDLSESSTNINPIFTQITSTHVTKDDPFQMFESVKPLEINKLLSFKQSNDLVIDSITDESVTKPKIENTTESFNSLSNRLLYKRPTKKPQKNKLNSQKLNDAEITKLISSTMKTTPLATKTTTTMTTAATTITTGTTTTTMNPSTVSSTTIISNISLMPKEEVESDLYNAARYTPLFAQSTKVFLPTPYESPLEKEYTNTVMKKVGKKPMSSVPEILTNSMIAVSSTSTTNADINMIVPNFHWTNNTINSGNESVSQKVANNKIKSSDLISLTKILGENIESNVYSTKMTPPKELTTKSPVSVDMLTNDMKNMLIALGILKSDNQPSMFDLMTSTTTTLKPSNPEYLLENLLAKREQISPVIDPNSYVIFKKIPIDFEKSRDKLPVSDEMKDLLASFGLLPKGTSDFTHSILTRISRQYNFDKTNKTISSSNKNETVIVDENIKLENESASNTLFSESLQGTLENLGLLKPLAYQYQPHKDVHVFQPTLNIEKFSDEQKVRKINDAINTIRKLSENKEAENLSVEDLEKQLENVTAFLKDEKTIEINETSSLIDTDDIKEETDKSQISTTTESMVKISDFTQYIAAPENSTSKYNISDIVPLEKFLKNDGTNSDGQNVIMNSPNPLTSEELQHMLLFNKNNVKRQQSNDNSTTLTSSEMTIEPPSNENADMSIRATENNASFSDLEASFGGSEMMSEEPPVDDLPTLKPNGLYFYLDWNTFLNVGEADRNPIRIRFSPRAGNPRHFLNITVP
ncbi:hypothetical protein PGB90_000064 [Kerria lacca]